VSALDVCALPLAGRHLIEASAGTGKTWTITSLVLRLLLGHSGALETAVTPRRLGEILIVTYTRAATEELRGRIRDRLRQAVAAFAGAKVPPEDTVIRTLLESSSDRDADLRRLELAATELDLASIFTIHGFAQRALRRNAFESMISFAADISEDDDEVVTETIRDVWRERVYPLATLPATLLTAERDVGQFVATLRGLLGKHDVELRNVPPRSWEQLLQDVAGQEQRLLAWWRENGGPARAAMKDVKLNKGGPEAFSAGAALLDAACGGGALLDREALYGLSRDHLAGKLARKKGNALPELALFDLAEELLRTGAALAARLLADARDTARERLAAIKQHSGLLGYDDLLRLLREGLEGPGAEPLARAIRTQFPVALIDEFQDTDPQQWAVFGRIWCTPDTALFLVGDPKQAIYAFRGADVQAYLKVRRETPSLHTLDTNYRSVDALLRALHALFTLRQDNDPFLGGGDMPLHRVKGSGKPEAEPLLREGSPPEPLLVLRLDPASPIAGGNYRTRIAAASADHLCGLLLEARHGRLQLAGRELRANDIACLVRDRYDARELARELARRGVPCAFRGRESVYAGAQARELYQLLAAVLEPGSERLLRAALGSALLGRTAAELDALLGDERAFAREQSRFLGFAEELRAFGVQATLRRLLFAYDVPARLLALPEGERALTDCLHLVELLQAEREALDCDEALLARFAQHLADPDGEREAQQLRLESDANRVQIVTLHAAKGLEYPVVYLPFMPLYRPLKEPYFHDPDTLAPCYDLRASEESKPLAERECLAEDMRLLYVGLTRAAHLCVLGVADTSYGNSSQSTLARTALGYLLGADLDDAATAIARLDSLPHTAIVDAASIPPARLPAQTGATLAPRAREFSRSIERDWQSSSYSALIRRVSARAELVFRQPELLGDEDAQRARARNLFTFPRGAHHGSFLHGVLERADFSAAGRSAAVQQSLARALMQEGYESAWLPVLATMLDDILDCALDGSRLRLRNLEPRQRIAEMAFEFPLAPLDAPRLSALLGAHEPLAREAQPLSFASVRGMLSGFIDLVFEHEGRYYVADYKSNHLGDELQHYAPPRLRESIMEHRYDLQYALYTVALSRLLRTRLGAAYDYDTHVGGVYYLFLRGMRATAGRAHGVYHTRLSRGLVEALDAMFAGATRDVA